MKRYLNKNRIRIINAIKNIPIKRKVELLNTYFNDPEKMYDYYSDFIVTEEENDYLYYIIGKWGFYNNGYSFKQNIDIYIKKMIRKEKIRLLNGS
jgi:hypothetical protein